MNDISDWIQQVKKGKSIKNWYFFHRKSMNDG